MKITQLVFLTMLSVSPVSLSFAEGESSTAVEKKLYSVNQFKKFFKEHKSPTTDLIQKTFGEPVLSPLFIQDSIAQQKGLLDLTPDQAWWHYDLREKNLKVGITVFEGKVGSVYIVDSNEAKQKHTLFSSFNTN